MDGYPLPAGCVFVYPQAWISSSIIVFEIFGLGISMPGFYCVGTYIPGTLYVPTMPYGASTSIFFGIQVFCTIPFYSITTFMCNSNPNNFPTSVPFVTGQSIAVPCIFNPSSKYCPNMNTACEKGLSILSDLSPF